MDFNALLVQLPQFLEIATQLVGVFALIGTYLSTGQIIPGYL